MKASTPSASFRLAAGFRRAWQVPVVPSAAFVPSSPRTSHTLALVGVFFAAAVAAASLGAAAASAPAPAPAALVAMRRVERVHVADGIVESAQQAAVAAQISGVILDTRVDAGDRVVKGQLLATIDAREAQAGREVARAQAAAARSRVTEARQVWERTRSLRERNFLSQAALDQARAALDAAEAGLKAAQSGEVLADVQHSHARVTAPQDGIVATRLAEAGELATPGRMLFVIHQPGVLRVVASVPASVPLDAANLRIADIMVPALNKSFAPGRRSVLPSADARDQSRRVRVDLDPEPDSGLIPGMTAKVSLVLESVERLAVPTTAIIWRGELAAVRLQAADGRPVLRQVRLGETYASGWVEVLAGVTAGERLLPANIRQ